MLRPLANTFGFGSSCFVCEAGNPRGLHVAFFHDTDDDSVVATLTPGPELSGAPNLVHGGVLAALCDDAAAWAAIACARRFALAAETRITYLAPVGVEAELTVRARIVGRYKRQLWTLADVRLGGSVCVRAEGRLTIMSDELAAGAGVLAGSEGEVLDAPRQA